MKVNINVTGIMAIAAMLLLTMCNRQEPREGSDVMGETYEMRYEDDEALSDLRGDMEKIQDEINEAIANNPEGFEEDVDKALDEHLEKTDNEISRETQLVLEDLKQQHRGLKLDLEKYGNETEEEWEQSRTSLKNSIQEFENDVFTAAWWCRKRGKRRAGCL